MEDIEDTKYFYDYALPDVSPLILENFSLVMKVMNMLWKERKIQIMIHLFLLLLLLLLLIMVFFYTVEEKHHKCAMYNLYNSDAFFQGSVRS